MKNIAICMETLGDGATGAILSISAASFDLHTSERGTIMHRSIELASCLKLGLTINPRALQAREETKASVPMVMSTLPEALTHLQRFFSWDDTVVWFDMCDHSAAALDHAYRVCGMEAPWAFYNMRDVATHLHRQLANPCWDSRAALINNIGALQLQNANLDVKQA